jgi:hypothetical protein
MLEFLAASIFLANYLFLGYPILRNHLRTRFITLLFYSHITSVGISVLFLMVAYLMLTEKHYLLGGVTLFTCFGMIGGACFVYDVLKLHKKFNVEDAIIILYVFAASFTIVYIGLNIDYRAVGDAYNSYVPIGGYINEHLNDYTHSSYRFSLSRNFAQYILYAQADLVGTLFGIPAYRLLPLPFVVSSILGGVALTKELSHHPFTGLVFTALYTISVYFLLLLKYNMYYLGNLFMVSLSLFHCLYLSEKEKSKALNILLVISSFSIVFLYDYALFLLFPFVTTIMTQSKRKVFWSLAIFLGISIPIVMSIPEMSFGLTRLPRISLEDSLVFSGIILISVLNAIIGGYRHFNMDSKKDFLRPLFFTIIPAIISVLIQRLANNLLFGFTSVDSIELTEEVRQFMQRNFLYVTTNYGLVRTLVSVLFSDVFFGWGFLLTTVGLFLIRATPIRSYFLSLLPLTLLVLSFNDMYFRFGLFLGPFFMIFLALGVSYIMGRYLFLAQMISLLALVHRVFTTFPSVDYEHKVLLMEPYVYFQFILLATILLVILLRRKKIRLRVIMCRTTSKEGHIKLIGENKNKQLKTFSFILVPTIFSLIFGSTVLIQTGVTEKYLSEIYPEDIGQVYIHVLPLLEDGTRVLTVELIRPNFHFYKHVEEVRLVNPWLLDNYLRRHLNNTDDLLMWLKLERIEYVFIDRHLSNNPEFLLVMSLASYCMNKIECSVKWDDGRFVLIELRSNLYDLQP